MSTQHKLPSTDQLLGAQYDQAPQASSPNKKLLICSLPRSGSNHIAKLLWAADLGLPLEYFHPIFEKKIAKRLGARAGNIKQSSAEYFDKIVATRTFNGIFATKLQYWQFDRLCRTGCAPKLFDGAHVVFLTRQNITAQAVSIAAARLSGNWHEAAVKKDQDTGPDDTILKWELSDSINLISHEEQSFRRFFAMQNIQPAMLDYEDLINHPVAAITTIADALGRKVDTEKVHAAASVEAAFDHSCELKRRLYNDILPQLDGFAPTPQKRGPVDRLKTRISRRISR